MAATRRVARTEPFVRWETVVLKVLREHVKIGAGLPEREAIQMHVANVTVHADELVVTLGPDRPDGKSEGRYTKNTVRIRWTKTAMIRQREVLRPASAEPIACPVRSETRALLVASIARGRRWLDELITDPTATTESIAKRESYSVRKVNMTISLAFLAPPLVKAAIDGRLPHGMGVVRLADLPPEWARQYPALGLATP